MQQGKPVFLLQFLVMLQSKWSTHDIHDSLPTRCSQEAMTVVNQTSPPKALSEISSS
jgi:hypothetical protein